MTIPPQTNTAASASAKPLSLGVIFLTLYIDLIGFSLFFPLGPELLSYFIKHEAEGSLFHAIFLQLQAMANATGAPELATGAFFAGALGSVYSLTQFIFSPIWGARSDQVGRRPVLMLTIAGNAFSFLVLALSGSFTVFLISRVVSGIMGGNLAVAIAAVSDVTSRENRAKGMGLVGAAFGIGFLTGPGIGVFSAHYNLLEHYPGLAAWGVHPFSVTALIGFGLCLVNLGWISARFTETLPPEKRGTDQAIRIHNPIRALLTLPDLAIRRANLVGFLVTFAFCFFETTITFFVTDAMHFDRKQILWIFVVNGLVAIFTQGFLVRRIVPKIGERRAALLGIFLNAAGLGGLGLAIGVAHSAPLMYGALTCCAIGSGFANVGMSALISLYAKPEEQGRITGIFRSLGFLARACSPIIAGVLYFWKGGTVTFGVAAAILVIPLILALPLPQPQK